MQTKTCMFCGKSFDKGAEWRYDMLMFEKYGIYGCLNHLVLNRDVAPFLK